MLHKQEKKNEETSKIIWNQMNEMRAIFKSDEKKFNSIKIDENIQLTVLK